MFSVQGILIVNQPNASESKHEVKYPFVGDRKVLRDVIHELQRNVRPVSEVRTMTDKRKNTQEVYSIKNSFTMAVGFEFECGPEPLYKVSGITQPDERLQVKVRSYFSLSKKHGKKCPAVAERWRAIATTDVIPVAGVGDFKLQTNEQYLWSHDMLSSREEVLNRMFEVWSCLERFAKEHELLQAVA